MSVPGEGAARPLQRELSQIHRRRLAPLIDRCLTEASRPDRLHRIESLELDLGIVDPENLEHDLVDKLDVRLREALAERLREEEHEAARPGGDSATASRLELVALFARTGCLPWWADTGDPRVLDESLAFLVENAPPDLAGLMRQLARDRRHLRRIVLHCDDAVLARLLRLLVPSLESSVAELPRQLTTLLEEGGVLAGATPARLRNTVWQGALLAACLEGSRISVPLHFWREVLVQIAVETEVTYVSLMTGLRRAPRPGVVVESLYKEIGVGQAAPDALPGVRRAAAADESDSRLEEIRRILERLQRTAGPLTGLLAALRSITDHLPVRFRGRWLVELKELEREIRDMLPSSAEGRPEVARDFKPSPTASAVLRLLQPLLAEDGGEISLPADVLRRCLAELQKSPPAPQGALHKSEDETLDASLNDSWEASAESPVADAALREEIGRILGRLQQTEGPLQGLSTAFRSIADHLLTLRPPSESASAVLRLLQPLLAEDGGETSPPADVLRRCLAELRKVPSASQGALQKSEDEPLDPSLSDSGEASAESPVADAAPREEIGRILGRLQQTEGPLQGLSTALCSITDHLPDRFQGRWLAVLRELSSSREGQPEEARDFHPARTASAVLRLLRPLIEDRGGISLPADALRRCLAELRLAELQRPLGGRGGDPRRPPAAAALPPEDAKELTELLRKAIREAPSREADEGSPLDLSFSDADEAYVENSGLVILWPFLGRFFERLDLLQDQRFRDESALRRGVGLLQYIATEDPSPPEYLLPLNKVLCGMEVTEVFDLGPPVSDEEAEECTNLLSAVIEHAPILHEMSIPGFRGSFVLRKGVLGTRDGVWLLRVERQTFDVVLDRFPWSVNWVSLPWMEAPLRVEW